MGNLPPGIYYHLFDRADERKFVSRPYGRVD